MLSDQSKQFKFMLQRLTSIINNATNFTSQNGTCIVLILTNNTSIIANHNTTAPFRSSHCIMSVELKFTIHKKYSYKRVIKLWTCKPHWKLQVFLRVPYLDLSYFYCTLVIFVMIYIIYHTFCWWYFLIYAVIDHDIASAKWR